MNRFENKSALITGGTSGFGLDAAKVIASEGGRIMVTGQSPDHIEEAKAALPSDAIVLKNDAADPDAARALGAQAKEALGSIDCLWLNAGYGKFKDNTENDAEFFDTMMNTNVRGPVLQMAELMPMLNDGGSVLLSASVAPYLGQAQGAVYGATKAACAALARSWSSALAERNVRVNSVAPGPIDTNFINATGMSEEDKERFRERIKKQVPLKRFGESVEVANVALFLLSDAASYVTGSEYMVDGGITKR